MMNVQTFQTTIQLYKLWTNKNKPQTMHSEIMSHVQTERSYRGN